MLYEENSKMPFGKFKDHKFEDIKDRWFVIFWKMNNKWYMEEKEKRNPKAIEKFSTFYSDQKFYVLKYIEDNFSKEELE